MIPEKKSTPGALAASLSTKRRARFLGLTSDDAIHYFFAGNAWIAIIVLGAITFALFREGIGFFPQHYDNIKIYREAGLEYVDYSRAQLEDFSTYTRALSAIGKGMEKSLMKQGVDAESRKKTIAPLETYLATLSNATTELDTYVNQQTQVAAGLKERVQVAVEMKSAKDTLTQAGKMEAAKAIEVEVVNLPQEVTALTATFPEFQNINQRLTQNLRRIMSAAPVLEDSLANAKIQAVHKKIEAYLATFPETEAQMTAWRQDAPLPAYRAVTDFIFGPKWVTQSFWQDLYGVLPLFTGSLIISVTALLIAVPFGIGAAIYVNQFAAPKEQSLIKPYIEFISAVPSVVLGFFGVLVLGESIRLLSQQTWMSWVPFFPISERLNAFTASLLLALMAIPTIFSLAEDAINNVPRAYKEASFSLGATRLQTTLRIIVPAALSGIIAAILLGFGRVIGETMVVLLLAGNRIQIPDFTLGIGAVFEPVHTMTGLIAQEVPEVVKGSLQYRALFMVGILLFFISLFINWISQLIVKRFKISIG
jgi:phosphate transport system permease protein